MVGSGVNCNGQKGLGDIEADWSDSGPEHRNRLASVVRADGGTPVAGARAGSQGGPRQSSQQQGRVAHVAAGEEGAEGAVVEQLWS